MHSPIANVRRRPHRSPNLPPVIMKAAMTSVYRVMVAWIAVMSVSKSSTSWLIDTFITEVSSTMRNCAVPSAANARHLFIAPSLRPTPRSAAESGIGARDLHSSALRRGEQGRMVLLVLIGIRLGEADDRAVEDVALAEVGGDGDAIAR